jgi:hypothetical protein
MLSFPFFGGGAIKTRSIEPVGHIKTLSMVLESSNVEMRYDGIQIFDEKQQKKIIFKFFFVREKPKKKQLLLCTTISTRKNINREDTEQTTWKNI